MHAKEVLGLTRIVAGTTAALLISSAGFVGLAQTNVKFPTLASPDKRLLVHFETQSKSGVPADNGKLVYSISFDGKPVVDASALMLELCEGPGLGSEVHINSVQSGGGADDYVMHDAKVGEVHDNYNSLSVQVSEA